MEEREACKGRQKGDRFGHGGNKEQRRNYCRYHCALFSLSLSQDEGNYCSLQLRVSRSIVHVAITIARRAPQQDATPCSSIYICSLMVLPHFVQVQVGVVVHVVYDDGYKYELPAASIVLFRDPLARLRRLCSQFLVVRIRWYCFKECKKDLLACLCC